MKTKPIVQWIEKPVSGEWGVEPSNGHSIGVIRNANFTNEGVMDLSDIAYRDITAKKIKQKALKYGDIIIEKSGGSPTQPVGRVIYYDRPDGEFMFSNFTAALRPVAGVDSRFLYYMLWATHLFKKTSAYQNKTTGIANLQLERYINEVEIPCPPLPTQRRIAAVLDKAQALVANDKRTLAVYDQLAKSLFLEMFGDPVRNERGWDLDTFENLVAADCPLTYGIVQPGEEFDAGVPIVRPVDLTTKHLKLDRLKCVDPAIARRFKRTELKGSELLLSVRGSVGVMSIATPELAGANVTRGIVPIWMNDQRIANEFIYHLFLSPSFKTAFDRKAKGATLIQINLKDLREMTVIVPPLDLVKRFVAAVTSIEVQHTNTETSLRRSEGLFGSLLQRAFAGELG